MKKCRIHIRGMHCRSCEILIEDELKKITRIQKVSVNYQTGIANIVYQHKLNKEEVAQAIENAGYSIGEEDQPHLFSRNSKDYVDLGIAFFVATAVFILVKSLGIFTLGNSISGNYSSLAIVFLIGLTAGISTCMALVGGLVLGASARFSERHPNASGVEKFKPHLFFNLGRIASYFILGGVVGFAGSIFQLSTSTLGILTVAVGLIMLLLGGQLIDIFPILKKISFTLPKHLNSILGIKDRSGIKYSNKNATMLGALTFFLPCGFTQAMQLYAMSTGNIVSGALTMGIFALGTAPGLLGIGGLTSITKGPGARLLFKTAGVIVITLALFNLSNGLNLLGIDAHVLGAFTTDASADTNMQDAYVKLANGYQEVKMAQGSSGYRPNKFTITKGIPVRWIITSEDSTSCASSIVSQQLGIRQSLQIGENLIEFTPTASGTIRFSCLMGMYTGTFNVVEGSNIINNVQNSTKPIEPNCSSNTGELTCNAKTNTKQTAGETIDQKTAAQVIKAIYTTQKDIGPNQFTVKANKPVRFEIEAKNDGVGCMGSVTIPGLTKKIELLTKGETAAFAFTPTRPGSYNITCAMGVPRGQIIVN